MQRLVLVPAVLFLAALLPAAAFGKGAREATITGPGLGKDIDLLGEGQSGGEPLMRLAEAAGFFSAVYGQTPDPMLAEQPAGELGPRYTISYVMFAADANDRISQDLYPYAKPAPVTYMPPGQAFYGIQETVGGWYVASSALKDDLVAVGFPETAPGVGDGRRFPWTLAGALAAAAALGLAALGALRGRSRSSPAHA